MEAEAAQPTPCGSHILAADIGGTFTDVVLSDPDGGLRVVKRLTTPADPTEALLGAVETLLAEDGVAPESIGRVVHGTTLATNVILERRTAPVALVTTAGFRWMLELGRQARVADERFDIMFRPGQPPVPVSRVFEVPERLAADGSVVVPLDEDAVRGIAGRIATMDVAAVAVCLLHAYANPSHERRVGDILRATLGEKVVVTTSSDVLPEIREYERTTTTLMSAAVAPVMAAYLQRLAERLAALGIGAPIHIMECSGGVMPVGVAAARAVYTIESGPAAGVVAAQLVGAAEGFDDLICFDMGGTTAKAGLVRKGKPDITYQFQVGGRASHSGRRSGAGVPIRVPAIDLAEVGAGGGSIVWIGRDETLHVGPRSAGSDPGPACYGRGGTEPTVTDADLVLGLLGTERFAGGGMTLDRRLAEQALEPLADRLGAGVVETASAVHEIANANMAAAVDVVTVQRGVDPREFALVCLGGAAPMHAARIAEQFGIPAVLVPPHAGVGSAIGLAGTDLRTDRSVTRLLPWPGADPSAVEELLASLARDAAVELGGDGEVAIQRSVDLRYAGQGHELTVALGAGPVDEDLLAAAVEVFYRRYRDEYGIDLRDPVELVTFRVRAVRSTRRLPAGGPGPSPGPSREAPAPPGCRPVWFSSVGAAVDTPVHDRASLGAGHRLLGPAIVEEPESTLVVPPGWMASVESSGTMVLRRRDPAS